jgi:hypothetical protein
MLGSARQLRLRLAAVAFALGETIELQRDEGLVGQQQCLDALAQTAQAQCDYRLAQLGRAGDVATLRVERDADFKPPSGIGTSHFVPRTDAMGLWCRM